MRCADLATHRSTWAPDAASVMANAFEYRQLELCPDHARLMDQRCLELGEPTTMRPIARAA